MYNRIFIIKFLVVMGMTWGTYQNIVSSDANNAMKYSFYENFNIRKHKIFSIKGNYNASILTNKNQNNYYLQISTINPAPFCQLYIKPKVKVASDLCLVFDYRNRIDGNASGDYTAVSVRDENDNWYWQSVVFSKTWKHAVIPIMQMKPTTGGSFTSGMKIKEIIIYSRSKNKKKAMQWLDVDNIFIGSKKIDYVKAESTRRSYSGRPMFNWPHQKKSVYVLEYSQKNDFPQNSTFSVRTRKNFFTPSQLLNPGIWFWRVKTILQDKKCKYIARNLLFIPDKNHKYKLPSYSLKKIADRPHPRLRKLAVFLNKYERFDAQRALLLKPVSIPNDPEPYSNRNSKYTKWIDWYKNIADGVIAKSGIKLIYTGKSAEALSNKQLTEHAKQLVLKITKWNPAKGSNIKNGDLQAGAVLIGMCWCYDAAYNILTPKERLEIRSKILGRAKQFWAKLNPLYLPETQNHTWNVATTLAYAAVVTAGKNPDAEKWLDYALQLYAYRFLPAMGFQGENNEGVHYWAYGGKIIVRFADLIRFTCGISLYEHPWLKQTGRFPVYCAPPGGYTISFADAAQNGLPNHGNKGPIDKKYSRKLGELCQDPYVFWYGGGSGMLSPKPPVDIPQSIFYKHIGWAVFNTCLTDGRANVALGFHAGKYFAGHQHADQNSFVINAYGDKLIVDGGYYDWFGSPHFNAYSTKTQAHNTILVNNEGQAYRVQGADGKIKGFFNSPNYGYVYGDASKPLIYGSKVELFERRIVFVKPKFIVVYDKLKASGEKAKFQWLIHTQTKDKIDFNKRIKCFSASRSKAQIYGKVILPEKIAAKVYKSYKVMPKQPFSSLPMPVDKVEPEWTLSVENAEPSREATFLTVMEISKTSSFLHEAEFKKITVRNGIGVEIRHKDRTSFIVFRTALNHSPLVFSDFESDADVVAIRLKKHKIDDAMVIDGKYLKTPTKNIFKSTKLGSRSLKQFLPAVEPEIVNNFLVNKNVVKLKKYIQQQSCGKRLYVWNGVVKITKAGRYSFKRTDKNHANVFFRLGDFMGQLNQQNNEEELYLQNKIYPFTAVADSGKIFFALNGLDLINSIQAATRLPLSYKIPADAIVIEAENFINESIVKGHIRSKFAASNGKAHCDWLSPRQWGEWRFNVPNGGEYYLLVKAAGTYDKVLRHIIIDGKALSENNCLVEWSSTGGWCNNKNEWAYFRIKDKIKLDQGTHTLRMSFVQKASNIDCFVLVQVNR